MQARIVPAVQGARWLLSGWRLFRTAPLAWLLASFTCWFAVATLSLVRVLGGAAAALLTPALTVGFLSLARAAEHGAALDLRLLLDGFRHRPGAQLALGVIYLAALGAVLAVTALADDGQLARLLIGAAPPVAPQALDREAIAAARIVAVLAYLPVVAAFWFAPPLVAWHSAGAAKAVFFSFFACLMNWRALAVYGALVAVVTVVLPRLLVDALAAASEHQGRFAAALVAAFILVLVPILFASFYASYRDVFGYHSPQ